MSVTFRSVQDIRNSIGDITGWLKHKCLVSKKLNDKKFSKLN